jgi:rubrerythrin
MSGSLISSAAIISWTCKYEPGMDFAEILRLAMKREEKALRMYNTLASKTDNADCIKLFKLLAQEEAKHKQTFETLV